MCPRSSASPCTKLFSKTSLAQANFRRTPRDSCSQSNPRRCHNRASLLNEPVCGLPGSCQAAAILQHHLRTVGKPDARPNSTNLKVCTDRPTNSLSQVPCSGMRRSFHGHAACNTPLIPTLGLPRASGFPQNSLKRIKGWLIRHSANGFREVDMDALTRSNADRAMTEEFARYPKHKSRPFLMETRQNSSSTCRNISREWEKVFDRRTN